MSEISPSLEDVLRPGRAALLVVDIQHDFVHPRGWGARHGAETALLRPVIPVINQLIAAAHAARVSVAYLAVEHGPAVDAANYRARYARRGMDGDVLCAVGTWGAALDDELTPPGPGDLRIVRHSYDGFAWTTLDRDLRARGVEAVVATGVVTNVCVQATAQHAFALGYHVVVVEDGTAAADPGVHSMTLRNIGDYFGWVTQSEYIRAQWMPQEARSR